MNKTILILSILFFINNIICQENNNNKTQSLQENLESCKGENHMNEIENTFILKTNLSDNELEELLSQDFSSVSTNNKRRRRRKNDIDVKQFKSKDSLNKTILLLEIDNSTQLSNGQKEEKHPYELIDVNENDETKVFLSFDKFFKAKYKEMFEYSYTIVIFIFVLIGMIIYYTYFLPQEASERVRTGTLLSNEGSLKNNNDSNYILRE